MNELGVLQRRFQNYLLHPQDSLGDAIVGSSRLSVEERLYVYADAYRTRLADALRQDFPGLQALLGDQDFSALVQAYIAAHPSHHFSIRWFGGRLSDFLAEQPRYANRPWLAEMAGFEWALSAALDAADAPRLGTSELAVVAPERWPALCFELHPSVNRLDLLWDVPPTWKAIDEGARPSIPQRSEKPQSWLIWRKDLASYFCSLDPDEAWALDAVRTGRSFAELCEGLCEWVAEEQIANHAAGLLRNWLAQGLISTFE